MAAKRVGEAGALFAFMGWLTSRSEVSGPFSATSDGGKAADLVEEFRLSQGWAEPEDDWHKLLRPYPAEAEESRDDR